MILRAEVYSKYQLEQAVNNPYISRIYAPYNIVDATFSDFSDKTIIIPPVFLGGCEADLKKQFIKLKNIGFDDASAHTIGHIEFLKDIGFNIYGSYRLNCLNSDSVAFYSDTGVKDIIISPEISISHLNNLKFNGTGFIAYGHLPLMITRRCPIKNGSPCKNKCCNKTITDRKGNDMSILCYENAVEILNSDVLYLADKMEHFVKQEFAVLKFTVERNINNIVESYINALPSDTNRFTRGLYFRGIKE